LRNRGKINASNTHDCSLNTHDRSLSWLGTKYYNMMNRLITFELSKHNGQKKKYKRTNNDLQTYT